MTQRVNIQYSIEVDKLQETVDYLYEKILKRIGNLHNNIVETSSYIDVSLIDEIDQLRREMAQIDIQLADIDRIVKGYVAYKSGINEANDEQIEPTVPTEK